MVENCVSLMVVVAVVGITFAIQVKYIEWVYDRQKSRTLYLLPIIPVLLVGMSGIVPNTIYPLNVMIFVLIIGVWLMPFFAWGFAAVATYPDVKNDWRQSRQERKANGKRPAKVATDDVKPFRTFAELEAAYKAENDAD